MKDITTIENPIRTKGDVIVQAIEIGDILYEYGYGQEIVTEVLTLPEEEDPRNPGYFTWRAKVVGKDTIIEYGAHKNYAHYGPNLYTYPAYRMPGK